MKNNFHRVPTYKEAVTAFYPLWIYLRWEVLVIREVSFANSSTATEIYSTQFRAYLKRTKTGRLRIHVSRGTPKTIRGAWRELQTAVAATIFIKFNGPHMQTRRNQFTRSRNEGGRKPEMRPETSRSTFYGKELLRVHTPAVPEKGSTWSSCPGELTPFEVTYILFRVRVNAWQRVRVLDYKQKRPVHVHSEVPFIWLE